MPFWPVVASSTSSTSSTGACFSITRLTLPSSSISPTLFCSRPAVSTRTTSTSLLDAVLDGLERDRGRVARRRGPRTVVGTPTRSPQVCSWSAAAARKVSAAPSSTSLSSATSTRASLPTVVVLPVPLTPTTSTTAGRPVDAGARRASGPSRGRGPRAAPRAASPGRPSGERTPWTATSRAEPVDQLGGRAGADVGDEQRLLDLVPGVLVEVVPREQGEQPLPEGAVGAGEPGPQASQPPGDGLGDLEGRRGRGARRLLDEDGIARQVDALHGAGGAVPRDLGVVTHPRGVVDPGSGPAARLRRGLRTAAPPDEDGRAAACQHDERRR